MTFAWVICCGNSVIVHKWLPAMGYEDKHKIRLAHLGWGLGILLFACIGITCQETYRIANDKSHFKVDHSRQAAAVLATLAFQFTVGIIKFVKSLDDKKTMRFHGKVGLFLYAFAMGTVALGVSKAMFDSDHTVYDGIPTFVPFSIYACLGVMSILVLFFDEFAPAPKEEEGVLYESQKLLNY
mmetsp:Transcript_11893/g.18062  ORF Transcript_11893/g.18062 Transcript_11893/m.18062 type:complete len:183 (-) Transcript_11893:245-793(-)